MCVDNLIHSFLFRHFQFVYRVNRAAARSLMLISEGQLQLLGHHRMFYFLPLFIGWSSAAHLLSPF